MSLHGIRAPRSASGPRSAAEVAAAQLDALERCAGERRLAQLAALEQDVLERRAVEVALAHAAVAEHDALERRVAEAGEVDPALVEGDVGDRRLRQLRSRQPAPPQLHPPRRESRRALTGPVDVHDDRVDEIAEVDRRRLIVERGRAGRGRSAASALQAN